ncbi:thiamine biosynthesis protein ThiS [[Pantoea] beijingensis]|uniref:Thiamine biosynthesis protein ThiS n=1 Tax=[Pantoea] beijingensis TaxID=1324864 RepID=A0A443IEP4_9GAMM|nr:MULTISPECIES: sulfur carrier protein ThiS [Erwiniaceae]RWR02532.1 thiamine biosynthesis protein ThiS [[Pantoea] beijingensis]
MKIVVNDEPVTLDTPLTLTALLQQLSRHQPGTALAVNQTIVPRALWDSHLLQEGDDLVIFQAIAGG